MTDDTLSDNDMSNDSDTDTSPCPCCDNGTYDEGFGPEPCGACDGSGIQ